MPKKKVKVYPRMNPDSPAPAGDFERRNRNVVSGSTEVEEVLQGNRGRMASFITTYQKPSEGFFTQFAVYLDRGGRLQFVTQGPEQGPFDSYEDARAAAVSLLSNALMAAADQADIKSMVNPSRRRLNLSDFYSVRDIEHFNESMTDLYEAALVELGEPKPTKKTLDAIFESMTSQVDDMLSRAAMPGFEEAASEYRDSASYGIVPEVSIDTLASLKGNLRTIKSKDFTKVAVKDRIAEFNMELLG